MGILTDEINVLLLSRKLQPWRPDSLTLEFIDEFAIKGIPFCKRCADWHQPNEECSGTS